MPKIFAFLLLFATSWRANSESLRISFIDYHPIVSNTPDGPTGYLIEFARPILDKAGLTPDWRQLPTHRGLIQLQHGQLDVIFTLLRSPEREQLVNYSRVPLFQAQSAVCSKPGIIRMPLNRPLRIAHFLSTLIPKPLQSHDLVPVTPEEVTQRMLTMLEKGRVDAVYYVYPEVLALSLAQTKSQMSLECHVFKELSTDVYMGYSKKMPAEKRKKLDEALVEQTASHDFRTYIDRFIKDANIRNLRKVDAAARDFELVKSPK